MVSGCLELSTGWHWKLYLPVNQPAAPIWNNCRHQTLLYLYLHMDAAVNEYFIIELIDHSTLKHVIFLATVIAPSRGGSLNIMTKTKLWSTAARATWWLNVTMLKSSRFFIFCQYRVTLQTQCVVTQLAAVRIVRWRARLALGTFDIKISHTYQYNLKVSIKNWVTVDVTSALKYCCMYSWNHNVYIQWGYG